MNNTGINNSSFAKDFLIFLSLVALLAVSRWIPHPANFTALTGVALFSGSYWATKQWRLITPLAALFVSDMVLGFYPGISMTYLAVAACVLVSPLLTASLWKVLSRGVLASMIFFVVSNLGVWISAELYPMTFEGLQTCFILAVPFYSATLTSSLFYSLALYSLYRVALTQQGLQGFLKLKHG